MIAKFLFVLAISLEMSVVGRLLAQNWRHRWQRRVTKCTLLVRPRRLRVPLAAPILLIGLPWLIGSSRGRTSVLFIKPALFKLELLLLLLLELLMLLLLVLLLLLLLKLLIMLLLLLLLEMVMLLLLLLVLELLVPIFLRRRFAGCVRGRCGH